MKADGSTFAHQHAEKLDGDGDPVFALPGTTFGPELELHTDFATPGLYRVWAQFETSDGDVVTVPFVVEASVADQDRRLIKGVSQTARGGAS